MPNFFRRADGITIWPLADTTALYIRNFSGHSSGHRFPCLQHPSSQLPPIVYCLWKRFHTIAAIKPRTYQITNTTPASIAAVPKSKGLREYGGLIKCSLKIRSIKTCAQPTHTRNDQNTCHKPPTTPKTNPTRYLFALISHLPLFLIFILTRYSGL